MGGWLGLSAVGAHQRAGLDGVKGDGGARGTSHKPRRRPARAHPAPRVGKPCAGVSWRGCWVGAGSASWFAAVLICPTF